MDCGSLGTLNLDMLGSVCLAAYVCKCVCEPSSKKTLKSYKHRVSKMCKVTVALINMVQWPVSKIGQYYSY